MSSPAFVEGWAQSDPLEDIRRYRTEISLQAMWQEHNKDGRISLADLEAATLKDLDTRYKFKPDTAFVRVCLSHCFQAQQLKPDPQDPNVIIKGDRW